MTTLKPKFDSGHTVFFDVDGTIIHDKYSPEHAVETVLIGLNKQFRRYLPNHKVMRVIRDNFIRGNIVVVWSARGAEWCNIVVKKLQLDKYVNLCISKPSHFVDDLPAFVFMPEKNRVKPEDI